MPKSLPVLSPAVCTSYLVPRRAFLDQCPNCVGRHSGAIAGEILWTLGTIFGGCYKKLFLAMALALPLAATALTMVTICLH
jgi:hypothetical protein